MYKTDLQLTMDFDASHKADSYIVCCTIIEVTLIGLKQPLVASQSQKGKLDILSQHAFAQSWAREARHAIPTCICPITVQ